MIGVAFHFARFLQLTNGILTFFRKDLISPLPYQVTYHPQQVIMLLVIFWMQLVCVILIKLGYSMEWNPLKACIQEQLPLALQEIKAALIPCLTLWYLLWVHHCLGVQHLNSS
jgi:hypothetical protein